MVGRSKPLNPSDPLVVDTKEAMKKLKDMGHGEEVDVKTLALSFISHKKLDKEFKDFKKAVKEISKKEK